MTQEERLENTLKDLWEREEVFAKAKRQEAEAIFNHKQKRAVEYLKADGTIKEREMIADQNAKKEMQERFQAEAESEIAYQFLQDARQAASARQSLLKAEMERKV